MDIPKIVEILKNGGVVIFPTETLYGLFCDATNPKAIAKIFKIKGRPAGKAFPILVKDFVMLAKYARVEKEKIKILKKIWFRKRPTTVILPAKNLPKTATMSGMAAFRISSHPLVKKLFRYFSKPSVATSANLSGQLPIKDSRKYREVFGERARLIDGIVFNGINRKRKGSRIVEFVGERLRVIRS